MGNDSIHMRVVGVWWGMFGVMLSALTFASVVSAETVLFIGDSHVAGPYGAQVEKNFKKKRI